MRAANTLHTWDDGLVQDNNASITNTGTDTAVVAGGGDNHEDLSYRELHVERRKLVRQQAEISRGKRSRAIKFWLVTQVLSLVHELSSSHPSLASFGLKAGGFALVMLLVALLPDPTEASIKGEINRLESEIERRNADFRTYHTGRKFYGGQRVYCLPEKQNGVLVSPARLRTSDMRLGRNAITDPQAIPHYDILLDSDDFDTFPETDYQAPTDRALEKINAWADRNKSALTLAGFVVALLGFLLAVWKYVSTGN